MAKRKSTEKTSSTEPQDKVEAIDETEVSTPSEDVSTDADTIADAVEAVDAYAPPDPDDRPETVTGAQDDDVVELAEPTDDVPPDPKPADVDIEASEDVDAAKSTDDHISEEEAERLIEDVEMTKPQSDWSNRPEASPAPVTPEIVRETVVEHKGGFVPMLLGGAVAAVLGYGVAAYVSQDLWPFAQAAAEDPFAEEMRTALSSQDGAMAGLSDRLTALEGVEAPVVDLSPIENQIATVQDTVSGLTARLDEIVARIDTLERQPMEQAVSPEAIAAYERALADLQSEVEAQRAEVEQMARDAMQAEGNATEQAGLAAARGALAEITAAIETGSGFADAVDVLTANGVDVPEALINVADSGVATQRALIESFPDSARDALSAVRRSETEDAQGASRVATFFANQLGARSVAPRDGDDADAILSRSEAAVRSGDLDAAISELSALPDVAQSAIADWQASAETRLEAKTAADSLVQQLLQK